MKKEKKKSRSDNVGAFGFVGSLMIGIGIGLLYGRPDVGTMVGLGIGFLMFALSKLLIKD